MGDAHVHYRYWLVAHVVVEMMKMIVDFSCIPTQYFTFEFWKNIAIYVSLGFFLGLVLYVLAYFYWQKNMTQSEKKRV